MSIRVFPAACSICPLPSWFVPLPLAFSPTSCLLLLVVGCHQVKVVALADSTLFPCCCRHAMFFFLGSFRFGSARS
ncbi:hypothetical protein GQ42DRAFT_164309 [Ramicandelaber brevisporus]|nr:hypothetical protein GQ42DRAFT_164309 [Ramicandelaber brevisporus]